ncbi:uncharacterized membrane protein YgaE (UPF0421/DUF939 family) [Nocardioides daedukensis]|uniref:Uncharacterized membrane protein YgaE (UPF0421/DUF939 family) n=1 Tax=Nocardioides daedukensis TaxID=634462 RepID=A0A7Y9RZ36_9ACTN|nr:hypothetical protein [Nocardioides daedukensis]NYG57158.1 uncharacterized membrane protein YgaE (UPF0421/DUF939 family) [Nocardioides daedukensis]
MSMQEESVARRLREAPRRHPLLPLAAKAAVAAALAWLVVQPLRGSADDYAYYAPLGAVVAVSSRLAHSMRLTVEAVLAIGLGALLAMGVRAAPTPEVLSIAIVVGLGTVLGAWKRVGSMASWVPISGLFILIVGGADPTRYVLAYLGLTALGAVVGVLVNLAVPPMPLIATDNVQNSLRNVLADQLDGMADGLERSPLPTPEEWREGEAVLRSQSERAQELIGQLVDVPRINWRARRWQGPAEHQRQRGQALRDLTILVEEMKSVLAHDEHAELERVALGPALRPSAARALHCAAEALRSVEDSEVDESSLDAAMQAAEGFAEAIRRQRAEEQVDAFAAGALVNTLRKVLVSLTPDEESHESAPDVR